MEHYWSLRYLLQEHLAVTTAVVVRDTLVRFERLPLWQRLADLPAIAPETRVMVAVDHIDLLAATLECRYAGLAEATPAEASP